VEHVPIEEVAKEQRYCESEREHHGHDDDEVAKEQRYCESD
jgi:hypothetical protein